MKHAAVAMAITAIVAYGCTEEKTSSYESRDLDQMLALGANQYLIDKYETEGYDTTTIRTMLSTVGREGPDGHPKYVRELLARGFIIDGESSDQVSPWIVERHSM